MDALKLAAVARPGDRRRSAANVIRSEPESVSLAPRVTSALATLLEAYEYAQDLGANVWDFAVELASMRRLKLTDSDLRWLVLEELAEHALETAPSEEGGREFRPTRRLAFCRRSCFALTSRGAAFARDFCTPPVVHDAAPLRTEDVRPAEAPRPLRAPKWDRNTHELRVGARIALRFKIPGAAQESILAAFEEEHWPERIDNPLAAASADASCRCLNEAIERLNRNQKQPLIRFLTDAESQEVRWELCAD